jgi:hypothetical protein
MTTWQNKLEGCFGDADKKFGRHPADEGRAKELKKELDDQGVSWSQVEKEIKEILGGCTAEHIETELKEAKRLLCFGEERK